MHPCAKLPWTFLFSAPFYLAGQAAGFYDQRIVYLLLLAVALALLAHDYDRRQAFAIAGLTGLIEAPAGMVGAGMVAISQPLLPWVLAAAAGAMLYVIVDELIPEAHAHGDHSVATGGLVIGFIIMLLLDVALT